MTNNDSSPLVVEISKEEKNRLSSQLLSLLRKEQFSIFEREYMFFLAKKEGVSCAFYRSGKCVISGKREKARQFLYHYFPKERKKIEKASSSAKKRESRSSLSILTATHIGTDESGKGDVFGPLCVASVHVSEKDSSLLTQLGVCDSKRLTDRDTLQIAEEIKKVKAIGYCVKSCFPEEYNVLYGKWKNLNTFLASLHSQVIHHLVSRSGCTEIVVDKFASSSVLEKVMKNHYPSLYPRLTLIQETKAERDLTVAAASILARAAFIKGIEQLSASYNVLLPKGASSRVTSTVRLILSKYGEKALFHLSKMHFVTVQNALRNRI